MPGGRPRRRLKASEIARVHEALRKLFREAGHGSITAAEEALGLQQGYFRHYRHQKTLDLGVVLAALEELGRDAGEFFVGLFGGGPPVDGGAGSGVGAPAAPAGTRDGRAARWAKAAIRPRPADRDPALRAELESWIGRMDDLRYEDPDAALVEIQSRAGEVPGSLAAPYLAVCASCYRMIGNLGDARDCLELAEEWAGGDDEIVGNVLQRLAYVFAYGGSFDRALDLAERAASLYLRAGNRARFGTAFVDQAKFLIHLGEPEKARAPLAVAKRYVLESDRRNRFAIEQYLMVISQKAENFDACLTHSSAARRLASDNLGRAMVLNTIGDVNRQLGRLRSATRAYREERKLLGRFPLNALLATASLVDVLAKQRRYAEALEEARTVSAYVGPLKGNKLAEASLLELYRQACVGCLRSSTVARLWRTVAGIVSSPRSDTLGDRLRRCRRLRCLSRRQVAVDIDLPLETLRKIESGAMPGTLYRPKLQAWLAACRPELIFGERSPAGVGPFRTE